ncbi:restriction endonuclease subunit S [Roseovarius sp.]|uniref:restriction endonuclease subunit S n=1 Tax=Roseovarius sp. TaxID=1486281 RepID=UPI003A97DFC3
MVDSKCIKISDRIEVTAGLALRGAAPVSDQGRYRILLPGSVQTGEPISEANLPFCSLEDPSPRVLLVPNDLVFWGRGDVRCAVFDGSPDSVILASPLLRLRRKDKDLLPEFLALCLASPSIGSQIGRNMRGSGSQFVSKKDLEDVEIMIPPVETQRELVEYADLVQQEAKLSVKLTSLRQAVMNAMLTQTQNRQTLH